MFELSVFPTPQDRQIAKERYFLERYEGFFNTAKKLAQFFAEQKIDYRFVGGYASDLLARSVGIEPESKKPKDIDVIVFDKLSVVKVFRAGYRVKEESPSASDIVAEPEILNTPFVVYTAEDRTAKDYYPIDIFVVNENSPQKSQAPYIAYIDDVPFNFLPPTEYLLRLKNNYEKYKNEPRYQDPNMGRMQSDMSKIQLLERVCAALKE